MHYALKDPGIHRGTCFTLQMKYPTSQMVTSFWKVLATLENGTPLKKANHWGKALGVRGHFRSSFLFPGWPNCEELSSAMHSCSPEVLLKCS